MKNNAFTLFLGLIGLLFATTLSAQNNDSFTKTVTARFIQQAKNTSPEKLYLQTDKPYYSAGEQIWFKGYLINAITHRPKTYSKFIYVELIDKSDSVFQRVKIRKDSLGFYGSLKLPAQISEGSYAIRAYTYWMRNSGDDFFFKKFIYIGNSIDDQVKTEISYGNPANDNIPATISFKNENNIPIVGKTVTISLVSNPQNKKYTATTNSAGKITIPIPLDASNTAHRSIRVKISEPYLKYSHTFFVPSFSKDFDIQFFPESGNLLANQPQIIAFKAIGANGLSTEVTGKIYNNTNEEVGEFSSEHKGMGKTLLIAAPDQSYYAIVKASNGTEKKVALPQANTQGITIRLSHNREKIAYEITNQSSTPSHSLYLLLHSRGLPLSLQKLDSLSLSGIFNESNFPAGITSFSVIDSIGNLYCERLIFISNNLQPLVEMNSNKAGYNKRDKVELDFTIQDSKGTPVVGNYSLSITDSKTVVNDTLTDNINSYLLLTSDLKGYIEDPGFYFNQDSPKNKDKLDLLMLTQGWRRFNTADVLKKKMKNQEYYLEIGQTISGKVVNLLGNPSKNADIYGIYKKGLLATKSDSLGHFMFDGVEFPDSTSIMLKAKRRKGLPGIEIIPDKDDFPNSHLFIPEKKITNSSPFENYLAISKEKYYTEGGMRVIALSEVTVQANKKETDPQTALYKSMSDYTIDGSKLEDHPGMNVFNLLEMVPGVSVMGEQVSIRGSNNEPLYVIDGIPTENKEDLTYLTSEQIESISVMKSGANTAFFGSRGGSGVIAITLKKGYVPKTQSSPSICKISPLGFQKYVEFYVPKYDVDSIRNSKTADLRTTIFWNPNVATDSTGIAHISFFTADKPNNYNVILEGVSQNGAICRFKGTIRREGY